MEFAQITRRDTGFQIAPMADMIFLLLIFFMLATILKSAQEVVKDLPVATYGQEIYGRPIQVIVNVKKEGDIVIRKTIYPLSALPGYLQSVCADTSKVAIYVRGDRKVEWDKIREIIKVCAGLGIRDVSFGVYEKGAVEK